MDHILHDSIYWIQILSSGFRSGFMFSCFDSSRSFYFLLIQCYYIFSISYVVLIYIVGGFFSTLIPWEWERSGKKSTHYIYISLHKKYKNYNNIELTKNEITLSNQNKKT